MIRKDESGEETVPRGFEQKGAPEPPERVLANFEALSAEDRLWVYEMISGWMGQDGHEEG